jgi:hypothetical protein
MQDIYCAYTYTKKVSQVCQLSDIAFIKTKVHDKFFLERAPT